MNDFTVELLMCCDGHQSPSTIQICLDKLGMQDQRYSGLKASIVRGISTSGDLSNIML
jgi:hypothetical protein